MKKRSLINHSIAISEKKACISLLRKKENEHGFLLIEYIDSHEYCIKRSDLFIDGSQPRYLSKGMALVELKDYTAKKVSQLMKDGICFKAWSTDQATAKQLIKNIRDDLDKEIHYSLLGDSIVLSSSFWNSRKSQIDPYHNCLSWATEKLNEVSLYLDGPWYKFVARISSSEITNDDESKSKSFCLVM